MTNQLVNDNADLTTIHLGRKNKYKRINSELLEDCDSSDQLQQNKDRAKTTKKYVLACAFFASLNSVLLGYDVGVMSGAIIFIQEDLKISDIQVELLVGCLSIVSLVGSLAGGKTSDAIGRKWTMALAAIVFQGGALVMTLAPSFAILMVGRVIAGIGIGFALMIAPVYIAEISPAFDRGSLTSLPEIFINFGILLGYISNYVFSGLSPHKNWRVMLGVGILPSVLIGFALAIIPESPRWLVMQHRVEEARSAIFRMLVVGIGIQFFQQITGVDALVYYSPEIIKEAGIKEKTKLLAATITIGVTKTVFILVAIFLIDKVGRKPLLYISTIGMTICLFSLAITLSFVGKGKLVITSSILLICGNVAFFSVGIGPISWVLCSEIFPLRLRAQAAALGATGNRICSGLVAMSFLSLSNAISVSGTFITFAAISALSVIFIYKLVPETNGKSLEEIELLFQNNATCCNSELELRNKNGLVQYQKSETMGI